MSHPAELWPIVLCPGRPLCSELVLTMRRAGAAPAAAATAARAAVLVAALVALMITLLAAEARGAAGAEATGRRLQSGASHCTDQQVPAAFPADWSVTAAASLTERDVRSGGPSAVSQARLPDVATEQPPSRVRFSYEYVVGYGAWGSAVPDNVQGPTIGVSLVDVATGTESVVYTSPELGEYDFDSCGDDWGEDDVAGDGCYSPPVHVDVPVQGFDSTEFYVRFTFTNNDRNIHMNEDGLDMTISTCQEAPAPTATPPPPPPYAECSLDAETDCCSNTGACPSSCGSTAQETEEVYGVDGVARSVSMCRCSDCAVSFPDEYPVDASTWCTLMGLVSCGGECVPLNTDCAFREEGSGVGIQLAFVHGCDCSHTVANHACSSQCWSTAGALLASPPLVPGSSSSWCDWTGEWSVTYNNGFRTTYTITRDGFVTASHYHGDNGAVELTASDAYECPGMPCVRLDGLYGEGEEEFLALQDGQLVAEHYTPAHCCTGYGVRTSAESVCGDIGHDYGHGQPSFLGISMSGVVTMRIVEGTNASYILSLQGAPAHTVTISINAVGDDDRIVLDEVIVFDQTNWLDGESVSLRALDDPYNIDLLIPTRITHHVVSADMLYSRISLPDIVVTVEDNDELALPRHLEMGAVDTGPSDRGTTAHP